jgi:hypothetical protein
MEEGKPPSDWEIWKNQTTLKKTLFAVFLILGVMAFPPILLLLIAYFIYKKRQGKRP